MGQHSGLASLKRKVTGLSLGGSWFMILTFHPNLTTAWIWVWKAVFLYMEMWWTGELLRLEHRPHQMISMIGSSFLYDPEENFVVKERKKKSHVSRHRDIFSDVQLKCSNVFCPDCYCWTQTPTPQTDRWTVLIITAIRYRSTGLSLWSFWVCGRCLFLRSYGILPTTPLLFHIILHWAELFTLSARLRRLFQMFISLSTDFYFLPVWTGGGHGVWMNDFLLDFSLFLFHPCPVSFLKLPPLTCLALSHSLCLPFFYSLYSHFPPSQWEFLRTCLNRETLRAAGRRKERRKERKRKRAGKRKWYHREKEPRRARRQRHTSVSSVFPVKICRVFFFVFCFLYLPGFCRCFPRPVAVLVCGLGWMPSCCKKNWWKGCCAREWERPDKR